mgnify:CR=1 FL=1
MQHKLLSHKIVIQGSLDKSLKVSNDELKNHILSIENPQKILPWVLITGTTIVTILYLGLNFVFLYTTPMEAMVGEVEVGAIAARMAFGDLAGGLFGVALALLLISTVSAMTMAGPRGIQVIGEDFPRLKFLGQTN